MSPTLEDGDYILIKKPRSLRPGFIYVVNHIDLGLIVKRLEAIENQSAVFSGDNPASLSDTLLGKVDVRRITGCAVLAVTPKGIKRLKRI